MKIHIKEINLFCCLILSIFLAFSNNIPVHAQTAFLTGIIVPIDISNITSSDELEEAIEIQIQDAITTIENQWNDISSKTDTYEGYIENADEISAFYEMIVEKTKEIFITLREDCVIYANFIMESDLTTQKKYKAIDDINDLIYEDISEDVLDDIYNGLLEDMLDYYYEDIIDDASDYINYSDWYDVSSNEYSQWFDASSAVYKLWFDASSDIYSFCFDLSGELYRGDIEGAQKRITKFTERIDKLKGNGPINSLDVTFNTEIVSTTTADELEDIIYSQVESCIQSIYNEWEYLSDEIDTYDKYINNVDEVEVFYEQVIYQTSQILIMIREYSISYAEMICSSGIPYKDMYNDFKDILDVAYDDACNLIKDDIYDGLLMDMKDYYYEGILKDAKDTVKYSDWADARSDAYKMWSEARSEVYSDWADARGDIYKFISDTRSELFSGDMEGAQKKIERFKKKIEKMK